MARTLHRLSARAAQALTQPGRHADGGGLYLSISPDGSRRRWVFLFRWRNPGEPAPGRLREMGLGPASAVSLAEARRLAEAARSEIRAGRNPLDVRQTWKRTPTFGEMADQVVASLEAGWRNEKHRLQWRQTLNVHCADIRAMPVDAITTDHILKVLQPLWLKVSETAHRLRGRIEKVLDAAKARGFRQGDNPARWRGHLDHLLPPRRKLTRGHHRAMPYPKVPALVARLRELGSVSAQCLEFAILTAARSGEALRARWEEIDIEKAVWAVPAERMKSGREHRVPLSARACEIITSMERIPEGDFVFPGHKAGRPLSNMALGMVLRRMKVEVTVHGFRSSFRDWAAERTSYPREVAEAALAHVLENKVEAAYRRSDLFERRRQLLDDWGRFASDFRNK